MRSDKAIVISTLKCYSIQSYSIQTNKNTEAAAIISLTDQTGALRADAPAIRSTKPLMTGICKIVPIIGRGLGQERGVRRGNPQVEWKVWGSFCDTYRKYCTTIGMKVPKRRTMP